MRAASSSSNGSSASITSSFLILDLTAEMGQRGHLLPHRLLVAVRAGPFRTQPLLDGGDPPTDRVRTLVQSELLGGELVPLFLSFRDTSGQLGEPRAELGDGDTFGQLTAPVGEAVEGQIGVLQLEQELQLGGRRARRGFVIRGLVVARGHRRSTLLEPGRPQGEKLG